MRDLVSDFTKHLEKAVEIGAKTQFNNTNKKFSNVLISGLGGSGIVGTIASQLVAQEIKVPVIVNKDYSISEFVDAPIQETRKKHYMPLKRQRKKVQK